MTKFELIALIDMHMLLMIESELTGIICYSVFCYAKANNRNMMNYNEHNDFGKAMQNVSKLQSQITKILSKFLKMC